MDGRPDEGAIYRAKVPKDADLGHITPDLRPLAVPVDCLRLDPKNLMTHPARNLAALGESLKRFKQRKPVVANLTKEGPVVEAGNGTLEVARILGWAYVAVVFEQDDHRTATDFAVADNRSAQLAVWDEGALAEWAGQDAETAKALGFDEDDLDALLGDLEQPDVVPWEMSQVKDRFIITLTGTLPLEAEVRRRLKDLPGEVTLEVSSIEG